MNACQPVQSCSESNGAAVGNEQAIGVFDSGVGGLTVFKAIRELLPHENMLYLGDTARLPYGSKSPETVIRYALQAAQKLLTRKVKALVIACNTATAAALPALEAAFPHVPILGVIGPGAEAACASSRQGHICVIATEGTIRSGAYQRSIVNLRPEAKVQGLPCPLFVPLAEEGWTDGPIAEATAKRYLDPVFSAQAAAASSGGEPGVFPVPDTLVLGCTHFPLLVDAIAKAVGPEIVLVDSAATTAKALRRRLERESLCNGRMAAPRYHFMTTDDAQRFARIGSRFLGMDLDAASVELVDI